jgi:hypothetical protein
MDHEQGLLFLISTRLRVIFFILMQYAAKRGTPLSD